MFATYQRLNISVWATDYELIRAASRKLRPAVRYARANRWARHVFYRQMIAHHHGAQDLARSWRL